MEKFAVLYGDEPDQYQVIDVEKRIVARVFVQDYTAKWTNEMSMLAHRREQLQGEMAALDNALWIAEMFERKVQHEL